MTVWYEQEKLADVQLQVRVQDELFLEIITMRHFMERDQDCENAQGNKWFT